MSHPPHVIALNKAKIALMNRPDSAFFSTLVFSLKHVFTDTVPTAETNGREIRYNPAYFMTLNQEQQVSLLLHEAQHCALLHCIRMEQFDKLYFNIAADYVVNGHLKDRNFQLGPGWLYDPKYRGMHVEDVYRKIYKKTPPQDFQCDLGGTEGDQQTLQHEMEQIIVRAAMQSKMAGDRPGTIPGDIETFLDKLLNPKLAWNVILQRYLLDKSKNDYSWRRPSRRFMPDFYLPSLYTESLNDVAVFADISASVSDDEFRQEVTQVSGIFKLMNPEFIDLGLFDTKVQSVTKVRSIEELLRVKFTGRGGTDVKPVFDWAKSRRPKVLLILSDGGFGVPQEEPPCDVIYLIHDCPTFTSPYGKVIHYELDR